MNHSDLTQECLSNYFNHNKHLASKEKETTCPSLENRVLFAVPHPTITIPGHVQIQAPLINF